MVPGKQNFSKPNASFTQNALQIVIRRSVPTTKFVHFKRLVLVGSRSPLAKIKPFCSSVKSASAFGNYSISVALKLKSRVRLSSPSSSSLGQTTCINYANPFTRGGVVKRYEATTNFLTDKLQVLIAIMLLPSSGRPQICQGKGRFI